MTIRFFGFIEKLPPGWAFSKSLRSFLGQGGQPLLFQGLQIQYETQLNTVYTLFTIPLGVSKVIKILFLPSVRLKGESVRRFKTFIVEDNAPFRQALLEGLSTRFPGMILAEASTGPEVLPQVATFLPDLIFMDIKIPGGNGLSLTQKIKAHYPKTIVIILTGYDMPEYRQAAYERGANYFLVKGSATNEEILGLVESILSAKGFNSLGSK